jgi:hypothetical protein
LQPKKFILSRRETKTL